MFDIRYGELDDGTLIALKREVQKEINRRKEAKQDSAIANFRSAYATLLLADVKMTARNMPISNVDDFKFEKIGVNA